MDPADLLFLHSTLAATIRAQAAEIDRLTAALAAATQAEPGEG